MTEEAAEATKKKTSIFADLSIPQVLAGALSAITVALILTKLGFSGTLIGAGIGSVMGALGTTAYSQSLNKSAELVKKKLPRVVEGRVGALQPAGSSSTQTVVMPTTIEECDTAETAEEAVTLPSYSPQSVAPTPEEPEDGNKDARPNWKSIALLAVVSLTVALAFLSFFEVRMLSENRADGVVVQRVIIPSEEPEKEIIVEREVVIVETPVQDNTDSKTTTPDTGTKEEREVEPAPQQGEKQPDQEEESTDEGENNQGQEQPTPAPVEPEEPVVPESPAPNPAPAPVVPPADDPGTGEQPAPPTQPTPTNPGSSAPEDEVKKSTMKTAGIITANSHP